MYFNYKKLFTFLSQKETQRESKMEPFFTFLFNIFNFSFSEEYV